MRRLVDLPHPDGPTRTRNSPSAMSMSSESTAGAEDVSKRRVAWSNRAVAMVGWVSWAGVVGRRGVDDDEAGRRPARGLGSRRGGGR